MPLALAHRPTRTGPQNTISPGVEDGRRSRTCQPHGAPCRHDGAPRLLAGGVPGPRPELHLCRAGRQSDLERRCEASGRPLTSARRCEVSPVKLCAGCMSAERIFTKPGRADAAAGRGDAEAETLPAQIRCRIYITYCFIVIFCDSHNADYGMRRHWPANSKGHWSGEAVIPRR